MCGASAISKPKLRHEPLLYFQLGELGELGMVGWSKLHRSTTARALFKRFVKDTMMSAAATLTASLVLSALHPSGPSGDPPRPPAAVAQPDRGRTVEPGTTATIEPEGSRPRAATPDRPTVHTAAEPRKGSSTAARNRTASPRLHAATGPGSGRGDTAPPRPHPIAAASSIDTPPASPPLDILVLARTDDAAAAKQDGGERRWSLGSTLGLARSTAETVTGTVLAWKMFAWTSRVSTMTGSLLDGAMR